MCRWWTQGGRGNGGAEMVVRPFPTSSGVQTWSLINSSDLYNESTMTKSPVSEWVFLLLVILI